MTSNFKAMLGGLGTLTAAGLALAALPAAAASGEGLRHATAAGDVSYDEAMACSSLFALLAASAEGETEEGALIDVSAQWLIVAARRDGVSGEAPNEEELELWVDGLIGELGSLEDDATREQFLLAIIDECEAKGQLIPDEFDF